MVTNEDSQEKVSFRVRRMMRESCNEQQTPLEYGTTLRGELAKRNDTFQCHFMYNPQEHGSILTLKLHVLSGEAEAFMSTETSVPCMSDYSWRSMERMSRRKT